MSRRYATVDLTTRLGSVVLPNPVLTASGTAGYGHELADHLDPAGLGAVVVKSLHAEPWVGNPAPRVHATPAGMVNSPRGRGPRADGEHIRAAAGAEGVPLLTTGNAALAAARGLADWRTYPLAVRTLQEYHQGIHFDSGASGS